MQHSHAAPFEEQKSPTDPHVQPESPRIKKWACEWCEVGKVGGHADLARDLRERLDVEGCRACAGIARFLKLADDVQWDGPMPLSYTVYQSVYGKSIFSQVDCEFFIKTPSMVLESTTELKVRADPSPSTSSTQAFNTLRHWIKKCEADHNRCGNVLPKKLPRRILEIESIEPLIVRVVENDASEPSGQQALPYACLSYRWDEQTEINSLNKANLVVYTHRVPRGRLYPLVKDAITAAWKLDLKHIWIDAYCIIQDDDDDWRREASLIGEIYENAFITISATSTTNKGRLFSQIRTPQLGYPITEHDNIPVFIRRCLEHPIFAIKEDGEFSEFADPYGDRDRFTHRRGWIFQERMLSTRIVHFLRGELFWECRESTWCECRSDEQAWEERRAEVPRTVESMTWADLIQAYCETGFTKEPDRLQALASVAKRYGEAHGKTYLAGMWFEDLPSTFLWTNYVPGHALNPRPLGCSAPSWSWTLNSAQEQLPNCWVDLNKDHPKPPCTLDFLGYSRNPAVDNIYADIHSVRLTIAGPTVLGTIYPRDECVVIMGTVWCLEPDFDMQPQDPSKYRAVKEGSEVLILLCRDTEDGCVILQGVDVPVSRDEVETEMFERIGKLYGQLHVEEEDEDDLASFANGLQKRLSSDEVTRQRGSRVNVQYFRDQAEWRTITLI